MQRLLLDRLLPALDQVGRALAVVAMAMILVLIGVMLFEVAARRFFDAPTIWAIDISYMTNGTLFLIGAAYTLRRNAHVRIDFLAQHLPLSVQHAVNLAFYLIVLLPALGLTAYHSTLKAYDAWIEGTLENMSVWQPVVWPFLSGIALGVAGLALQIAVESARHAIGIHDPKAVPGPSDTEAGAGR